MPLGCEPADESEITVWLCRRDHGVCVLICNPSPLPSSFFFANFTAIKIVGFSLITRVLWCVCVQLCAN